MSLRDKLKSKKLRESILTIDQDRYLVKEVSKLHRSDLFAKARDSAGKVKGDDLENIALCECVCDAETGERIFAESEKDEWNQVGSSITAPLFAEVMRLNGMDDDDVGREVKKFDSTDSSV